MDKLNHAWRLTFPCDVIVDAKVVLAMWLLLAACLLSKEQLRILVWAVNSDLNSARNGEEIW